MEPWADVDTALITLSPEFLEAVRSIAPKKRRAKLAYVVCLGLLVVAAVLCADPSVRKVASLRWGGGSESVPVATVQAPPVVVAQLATSERSPETPTAPVASTTANVPPAGGSLMKVDRRIGSRALPAHVRH